MKNIDRGCLELSWRGLTKMFVSRKGNNSETVEVAHETHYTPYPLRSIRCDRVTECNRMLWQSVKKGGED